VEENMPDVISGQEMLGEKTEGWFTVLANQLATEATRTSGTFLCTNSPGVMFEVVTNAEVGTVTLTPKVLVPNAVEGGADIAIVTFTAISASGTNILVLHPSATDMGAEDKVGVLPREWKLELTYSGADTTHVMDSAVYARYI
jgi:hypothetical protein